MQEYIENSASLGWLIYPKSKQVFVYRPNKEVETLETPSEISDDLILQSFTLNLEAILK